MQEKKIAPKLVRRKKYMIPIYKVSEEFKGKSIKTQMPTLTH